MRPTHPRPPARLTALATSKLPRWVLFAVCLLYILPGLMFRDPWKSEDATGFGAMWTMATGAGYGGLTDWLLPNVAGLPELESGPLMFWVGAACIKLFGLVATPAGAARIANVLFFFLASAAIWYSTYLLGRRLPAQPLALAFGGEPDPRDYGRTLADGALLIFVAALGLLTRMHESSADVAMLASWCVALYAMARGLDGPRAGALWLAAALTAQCLSGGPVMAALAGCCAALVAWHPDWRAMRRPFVWYTLPLVLAGSLAWPLAALQWADHAQAHFAARVLDLSANTRGSNAQALSYYARTLVWFTWPVWPIAGWAVWSWRRQLAAAHILLPLGLVAAAAAYTLITPETSDSVGLIWLPGLVGLAAFGLPTLKRGAANGIDWFSLTIFTAAAALIWLGWIATMTGYPPKVAYSFARQTPGFVHQFSWVEFLLGLAATAGWLLLMRWRVTTHPKVVWRSVVLASAGSTLSWTLLMTLWMPSINYSKTYRQVAVSMARAIPPGACTEADGLGPAQRASFAYFAGVRFAPVQPDGTQGHCEFLLVQENLRQSADDGQSSRPADKRGYVVWEGRRPSDREERFRLYRREAAAGRAR